jgi:methionine synthase I (cobalamin-dependent)
LDYDPDYAATVDSADQVIKVTGVSAALNAKILYPANLKYENADVGWFAKQVSASINNMFAANKEEQIVAVLTALPSVTAGAPVSRLVKGENAVGAVVDSGATSRAAVFGINTDDGADSLTRKFDLLAQADTTCYLFSLQPNTGYDVAVSAQPGGNGLTLYTLTVHKGQMQTTNAEGTLVIRLGGARL